MSRWSLIDALEINSFKYLSEDDECYYYLERSKGNFLESHANDVVNNFQKDIERYGGRPEVMKYKEQAIQEFACALSDLLGPATIDDPWVIIPMITSKPKHAANYDDRLVKAANCLAKKRKGEVVVADILDIDEELRKAKVGGFRDPHMLADHILVDSSKDYCSSSIVLIDDVITSGGHFVACKQALLSVYPEAQIIGAFLSRHISVYEYELCAF